MTETGKSDETSELPLEGSPNRKQASAVESADNQSGEHEGAKSDTGESAASSSSASLFATPKAKRKSEVDTPSSVMTPVTPTNNGTPTSAMKRKRMTPEEKSLREKERQEKRLKLEEEKQKKEQEKIEKAKQKEMERLRKEEEKRRLEEEKRLERLKKEEERKKLEEERKQERLKKEEERKKVEEERKQEKLKKEEERKRKEDEKKQKEEEKERERLKLEEKKTKQAQYFTKFFHKSAAPKVHTIENGSLRVHEQTGSEPVGADSATKDPALFNPLPFQVKTDMAVAPLCRRELSEKERGVLDSLFVESSTCADGQLDNTNGFLISIKKDKGRKFGRTDIIVKDSPEIQVLDEETRNSKPVGCYKWRMKLLQFHDNRRPAYWGTWKRKPKKVTARRPQTKEDEVDYDFDSDDEWEDEPEDAEEIGDSGDEVEDQEEGGDGDEDEEGWMVPHGYLSDSEREGKNEDLESLKCKEKEFYKSLKEKTLIGLPFILTEDLSSYSIRLCPVFRSATVVKKRKPRAPKKKAVEEKEVVNEATPTSVSAPVNSASKTVTVTPKTVSSATKNVTPAVDAVTSPPQTKSANARRSKREQKITSQKPNPYAHAPSGFLAMELPSDDEEDMDWATVEDVGSSGCSDSNSEDSDADNDDDDSSSSDEDLFIPIIPPKSKN